MPANVSLQDTETKTTQRVTPEGAAVTTLSAAVPVGEETLNIPFSEYLTVDGDGVTSSLAVDGSTTNIDAYIGQDQRGDVYLTQMSILLGGTQGGIALNKFGNLPELLNGVQVFYGITRGKTVFPLNFKTAFGFIRLGTETLPTGGKTDAFQLQNVGQGNLDAYLPTVDLTRWSPLGFGIRIRKDSLDRFGVTIRDNLTALSAFNILTAGYVRLQD